MSTVRKLIVEVVDARDLLPKDGHGTSSPYVLLDYYGQRKRTQTVIRDLNPAWNELFEFNVANKSSDVFEDVVEVDLYHDKTLGPTRRSNFLGRIRLSSGQFVRKGEEALIYYPLGKKHMFSWVQGEIGLKIYYVDEVVPPSPPPFTPPPAVEPAPGPVSEKSGPMKKPEADAVNSDSSVKESEPPPPPEGAEEPSEVHSAPLPEISEPEPKNPPVSDTAPQVQSENPVEREHWQPVKTDASPELNAFTPTRAIPGVNISTFNGSSSMASDPSETSQIDRSTFDLVNKMHYLFVRVVKARSLPTNRTPVVKIMFSGHQIQSKPAMKTQFFEWDQTFAFGRETHDSSSVLEISVWDVMGCNFLGGILFDVIEIPLRDPPDSPLAPQWYRLEGGEAHIGDLMLATWLGTQADESFPDAWKTDTAGNPSCRAEVYQSPKLWYLRLTVMEAQDIFPLIPSKENSFQIKSQLGFQVLKTKPSMKCNGSLSWNDDLMFVAAEPFSNQHLIITLEQRQPTESVRLGVSSISLTSIERRIDDRHIAPRWFSLDDPKEEGRVYKGRVRLSVCFDGGYHVMDEAAHVCSDYRPTARQLWNPPVGSIELGIVGCKNLQPMKTINGKGSTDAYAVAKYGNKWVRTRTISDSLDPKWNEQYTWKVYEPFSVLTIGVFDSWEVDCPKESVQSDFRIGNVRIRVSTLRTSKVYRNSLSLILMTPDGLKKMGEIELAVRFVSETATLDMLHVYSRPLFPLMHHIRPLGEIQQEVLRTSAVKILAAHLARSEPPLPPEVVTYLLDSDSHTFSMRKVRSNWFRIITIVAGLFDVVKWVNNTSAWKNPTATLLVHALMVMLVWYPDLIFPTWAFYLFVIGAWNYRFPLRDMLPQFDTRISLAESIDSNELDEEFDAMPSSRPDDLVRARYNKLRMLGARFQKVLGDFATQGERVQALVTWRDPRATGIFLAICFSSALILYLVPSKMIVMSCGFYYLRHPIFRDHRPSPALNFFRRLPSLSDRIM